MKSLSSVQGVSGIRLGIFYSMADISGTVGRILIPFAGVVGLDASFTTV